MRIKSKSESRKKIFEKSVLNNIVFGIVFAFLIIICLIQVFLILWMMTNSLKTEYEFSLDPFALPEKLAFSNYSNLFQLIHVEIEGITYYIEDMIINSVAIALFLPISTIVMNILVAYVCAKIDFKLKGLILGINFFVMILPVVGNLSSQLVINNLIGRYDNLFMMSIIGGQPFGMSVLMYMAAFKGIPNDYMEAASIDGAGHFKTFLKIMLPPVLPMALVFYILAVMASWSDYQTPLIWLPSCPNLALGMYLFKFNAKDRITTPIFLAGYVLLSVPSAVFFLLNQSLISKNLMIGGLKG